MDSRIGAITDMSEDKQEQIANLNLDRSTSDFRYAEDYAYDAGVGLNENVVRYISKVKDEPQWILDFRLKALKIFLEKENPTHWASERLDELDYSKIHYGTF